jgi:uncharacterized membrane protein HdeD (DUF308 family)
LKIELTKYKFQQANLKSLNSQQKIEAQRIKMTEVVEKGLKKIGVTVSKPILALIAIIFGLLVIILPELLELIVGLYFIIQGVLLFTDYLETKKQN